MLLLIIKKEIAAHVLSFRFAVTYPLVFGLILLSTFLLGKNYQSALQQYTHALTQERGRIGAIHRIKDPDRQFDEFQRTTFSGFRRPKDMSILARGLEGKVPTQVSGMKGFFFRSNISRFNKNVLFDIFSSPDLVYVVNIVMSLLALLFAFDAVCGEREQGTLKLALSNALPRDILLLGKWISGYLTIAVPFCTAVLAGLVYIHVNGTMEINSENLKQMGLIIGASLLYISTFFTLGLMISTLFRHTSTALVVSLLVWICWTLVVPNLSPVIARLVSKVPSRQVIHAQKAAIDRETRETMERTKKSGADEERRRQIQVEAAERKSKLEKSYQAKMKARTALGRMLARLSPSASFLFASTRLAGTGPELYEHFRNAHEHFIEESSKYSQGLWGYVVIWEGGVRKIKKENWFNPKDLPKLRISNETVRGSFHAASFDLLTIVVYNVLFFMGAYLSFLKYDVT